MVVVEAAVVGTVVADGAVAGALVGATVTTGALVGGACLKADSFAAIVRGAIQAKGLGLGG